MSWLEGATWLTEDVDDLELDDAYTVTCRHYYAVHSVSFQVGPITPSLRREMHYLTERTHELQDRMRLRYRRRRRVQARKEGKNEAEE